jgi:hypothetical protein
VRADCEGRGLGGERFGEEQVERTAYSTADIWKEGEAGVERPSCVCRHCWLEWFVLCLPSLETMLPRSHVDILCDMIVLARCRTTIKMQRVSLDCFAQIPL